MEALLAKVYTTAPAPETEQGWLLSYDEFDDPLPPTEGGYYLLETADRTSSLKFSSSLAQRVAVFSGDVAVAEMVQEIRVIFGLNIHQVAQLVGVSRATLYNHTQRGGPVETYLSLYQAARATRRLVPEGVGRASKAALVDGQTLFRHLKVGYQGAEQVARLARRAVDIYAEQVRTEPMSRTRQKNHLRDLSTQG